MIGAVLVDRVRSAGRTACAVALLFAPMWLAAGIRLLERQRRWR